MAKVEGRLEELSKRIDDLNHRMTEGFSALNKRIDDGLAAINKRIDDLRSEVRLWFVIITVVISLVIALSKII